MVRIKRTTKTSILDRFNFSFDIYFLPEKDPLKNPDVIEILSYNDFEVGREINISIVYTSEFLKFIKTLKPEHLEQAIKINSSVIFDPRVPFIIGSCHEFIQFMKKLRLRRRKLILNLDDCCDDVVSTLRIFYGKRFVNNLHKLTELELEEKMKETESRCQQIINAYTKGLTTSYLKGLSPKDKGGPPVKVEDLSEFQNTFETIYKDFKERFKNADHKNPSKRYESVRQYIEENKIIERFPHIGEKYTMEISGRITKEEELRTQQVYLAGEISGYDWGNETEETKEKPKKKGKDIKGTTNSKTFYLHPSTARNMAICLASAIHRITPLTGKQYLKPSVKNPHA